LASFQGGLATAFGTEGFLSSISQSFSKGCLLENNQLWMIERYGCSHPDSLD
jgi:hypothetical protein